MCLVVLFSDFGITNPKISCPEDLFQGRPRATTPAEDRFHPFGTKERTTTVPQLVADHFQASGRRISATTVRNRSQCRSVCKKTSCVRSLNGRQRRNRLCWQENMFFDAATMGFCAVHRRVQIYNGE
ncbi:glutamate receptor ionotropic, kainate 2 [Trichonephila clavipes]|nr:glutamate receptor ionotropic, kainate 2 [Trichonephila clavipes]